MDEDAPQFWRKARSQFHETEKTRAYPVDAKLDKIVYRILDRDAEVDALAGDFSKARTALGWAPTVKFNELLAMMTDADLELARRELRGQGQ